MTKADLIKIVEGQNNMTNSEAKAVVDSVFEAIETALVAGEEVSILGFGKFEVRERAARKGKNPRTGEEIDIASSKLPVFSAGKKLKDAVNA